MSSVQQIIAQVAGQTASQLGFTPAQSQELQAISLATAQLESGFNPNAENTSDSPPDYGIFQLNPAGEGSGLTVQQMEDPTTNAQVAIPVIAQTLKAHPNWSPGQIAAAAQRPANPSVYAADVNSLYPNYSGGQIPSGSGNYQPPDAGAGQYTPPTTPGITIATLPVLGAVTIPSTAKTTWTGIGANIGAVVLGAALIVIGILVAVKPHLPQAAPVPVPV